MTSTTDGPVPAIELQERTVTAGRRSIFVRQAGQGAPVVLLHGGGPGADGLSNYGRNIAALAEHFTVIVPDLPGYGGSSKDIDRDDPFGSLADGIRGMLDALEINRAHLVGNSYGGACALRLALDTPDRVERMVLMGPGGIGTTRGLPTSGLNALLGYYTGSSPSRAKLESFIRTYLVHDGASVPSALIDQRYEASIDPAVVANPPLRRPSGLTAARTLWRMDLTRDRRLAELDTPTLVIWGTHDKVNRPSGGPMLAERMPRCDLLQVSEAGHWVQWERAELFNQITARYLAGENEWQPA